MAPVSNSPSCAVAADATMSKGLGILGCIVPDAGDIEFWGLPFFLYHQDKGSVEIVVFRHYPAF